MLPPPPRSTLFPYTTLFRSAMTYIPFTISATNAYSGPTTEARASRRYVRARTAEISASPCRDRKSTRLNSSHLGISYAVFCLKKKKNKNKHEILNDEKTCRE